MTKPRAEQIVQLVCARHHVLPKSTEMRNCQAYVLQLEGLPEGDVLRFGNQLPKHIRPIRMYGDKSPLIHVHAGVFQTCKLLADNRQKGRGPSLRLALQAI